MGSIGELQHLVLLGILRLGGNAYGVTIRDEIRHRAGRDLSLGAIYSALRRLQSQSLIEARVGDPERVVGGRAKTYFTLTPAGMCAVQLAQEELARMVEGIAGLPLSAAENRP
jgi:PadR family transcriptional regulator, regulatory protein PadR